jgi:hypothetical protein
MTHVPGALVGADSEHRIELVRRHALFKDRRVSKEARPGAMAIKPTFDRIIEAMLDANPEAMREHQAKASPQAQAK